MITFKTMCNLIDDQKTGSKFYAVSVGKTFIEGASEKFRNQLTEKYYRVHIAKKSTKQLPAECHHYIDITADEKDCFISGKDKHPTIVVMDAKEIVRK